MKVLYAVAGGALVALGVLHMVTTFRLSSSPAAKVWFFGTGLAIVLAGILNLLSRRYGLAASGLRAACIGTNAVMVAFCGIAGRVTAATVPEQAAMLALLISTLVLSVVRLASVSPVGTADR